MTCNGQGATPKQAGNPFVVYLDHTAGKKASVSDLIYFGDLSCWSHEEGGAAVCNGLAAALAW